MRGAPIRFLVIVAALWGIARSTIVWTTPGQMADDLKSLLTWADPPAKADVTAPVADTAISQQARPTKTALIQHQREAAASLTPSTHAYPIGIRSVGRQLDRAFPSLPVTPAAAVLAAAPPPDVTSAFADRFTLASWAVARGAGTASLAGGGQLGGSQAGFRASFALSPTLPAAGRFSTPLRERGAEAAVALDWRPIRTLPVTLTAERRIRIDRAGRNAFALGVSGGIDAIALPAAFRLDGYAQAGVVGLRRRDGYVDGALRIERPIADLGPVTLALGGGVWGAAQPGASRLDIGPQLVARVPAGATTLRLGLDWRERVAGNARPGSGPALSIGADF